MTGGATSRNGHLYRNQMGLRDKLVGIGHLIAGPSAWPLALKEIHTHDSAARQSALSVASQLEASFGAGICHAHVLHLASAASRQ